MAAGNASTLITSVLLGVIVFQESISRDPGTLPVALLALAFAVLGVVLLASPDDRPPNQRIRQTATDT